MKSGDLILGKYRIASRLGEGGMGTVFRARDELLDRDVAIKVLRADLSGQASLVERFRSEAIALARLGHPRIASLHGLERDRDQFMMVMEFVHGETLEAIIQRGGPIPWRRAVEYAIAVCDALEHAHEQGVVHRDIKPANIMVTRGDSIKVMDFGIARVMGRSRHTQLGRSVGTPMYMAPEQLRGEEVDGRADTYALGAVLYEMLTGRVAFDADSDYSLMMKQLNDPPPRPSLSVAGLPLSLDEIVTRAMAKRREDRYAGAAAMRASLETVRRVTITPAPHPVARPVPEPVSDPIEPVTPAPQPNQPVVPPVPPTRLSSEPGSAIPPTRLAPAPPPGAEAGPTRLASEPAPPPVPPTRIEPVPRGKRKGKWATDWKVWATAAALLLIATLTVRSARSRAAEPVAPDSITATQPGPAEPIGPAGSAESPGRLPNPREPVRPAPPSPVPPSDRSGKPTPEGGEPPVVSPAPAPAPLPPPVPAPVSQGGPAPTGGSEAASGVDRAGAAAAVQSWVSAIGSRQAARLAGLDGGTRLHAQLLELVREGRVAVAGQEPPALEFRGFDEVSAVVETRLSYRSPFGATRRAPVRFALDLLREGGSWRITRARILGSPRLD